MEERDSNSFASFHPNSELSAIKINCFLSSHWFRIFSRVPFTLSMFPFSRSSEASSTSVSRFDVNKNCRLLPSPLMAGILFFLDFFTRSFFRFRSMFTSFFVKVFHD